MLRIVRTFFKSEASIGISLLVATVLALLISNSENFLIYQDFLSIYLPLNIEFLGIAKEMTMLDWINDALMAIFFLLVGMELKREILVGELSSKTKVALPAIAALGGVVVPALIFFVINRDDPGHLRGFAIPCATDIAFAYGMISLFGKKISNSLKVFLVALAILDDLVAILIIAFFYTNDVQGLYLVGALFSILCLAYLNYKKTAKTYLFLFFGAILWLMVLKSGVHATVAGVILAMFIPMQVRNKPILPNLAHKIAPVVNFLILPIFAFANSGVHIEGFSVDNLYDSLVLGIVLALFFGKQIGVVAFSLVAVKMKIAHLPRGADWFEFYAAAILTGIGFTMSLFISSLAFADNQFAFDEAKIGVLVGSLLSTVFGMCVSYLATSRPSTIVRFRDVKNTSPIGKI